MPFKLMNHFRVQSKQLRNILYIWNYILFILWRRVRIFKWREKSLSTFHITLFFLSLLLFFPSFIFRVNKYSQVSVQSNRIYVRYSIQSQKYFIHAYVRKTMKSLKQKSSELLLKSWVAFHYHRRYRSERE